jgi:hypothetical protein
MVRKRRRGWWLAAAGVVVALVATAIGIKVLSTRSTVSPSCRVAIAARDYTLSLEQAANATTIAAVGKRLGMPDHAVTIALAAALEESGLLNLAHGDRDSLGLFQQRPSQGWGTPAEVMTPHYAAAAFYEHLARVPAWQSLPITVAAQSVQHSATPGAYAATENAARALAIAMTGEIPAGLTCRVSSPSTRSTASLEQAMAQELGAPTFGTMLSSARGWTVASWLVGHATQFQITSVGFAGQMWTSSTGEWQPHSSAGLQVEIARY